MFYCLSGLFVIVQSSEWIFVWFREKYDSWAMETVLLKSPSMWTSWAIIAIATSISYYVWFMVLIDSWKYTQLRNIWHHEYRVLKPGQLRRHRCGDENKNVFALHRGKHLWDLMVSKLLCILIHQSVRHTSIWRWLNLARYRSYSLGVTLAVVGHNMLWSNVIWLFD